MTKRAVVHIEIPAANRESLASFYLEAFGWTFQHITDPAPYSNGEAGNLSVGLPDLDETYRPGAVVVYVDSEDVAGDLRRIEALGGKRLSDPFIVGSFGEMAFFADPTGNRLALWKNLMPGM